MSLTVVVAPDSFKGSVSADRVAHALSTGWLRERPHDRIIELPQADGGEGTLDAIHSSLPGAVRRVVPRVTGPDGREVDGQWLQLEDGTAVVELAQSSGLPLMKRPDPLGATTRGLGQVILAAIQAGSREVWIGLGGSASTDGGVGALAAMGAEFLDETGAPIGDGGAALSRLARVDTTGLVPLPPGGVRLLTDVTAPLLGPAGAAAVFGPQKGASPAQVAVLEAALSHFSDVLGTPTQVPGMGAAGGCGFGFATLWHAEITPGWRFLAERSAIANTIANADILLTGEGRFDDQSRSGKVVGELLGVAAVHNVTTAVIAGQITTDPPGWSRALVQQAGSLEAALAEPEKWLREAAAAAASALAPAPPAI